MRGCSTAERQSHHETDNINIVNWIKNKYKHKEYTLLWDVTLRSLVQVYWSFEGIYCLHLQRWRVDQTVRSKQHLDYICCLFSTFFGPEGGESIFLQKSVNSYCTIQCHVLGDGIFHQHYANLKSCNARNVTKITDLHQRLLFLCSK